MTLLLPLLLLLASPPSATSTLSIGAVEPCLRELSEDRVVRVAPPINRGTLLVEGASGEAPFSTYKEILAQACSGTWSERGGELILAQTPQQAAERREAAKRRRMDSLGARLKEFAGTSGTELRPVTVEEAKVAVSMFQQASAQLAEPSVNGRSLAAALARLPARRLMRIYASMLPVERLAAIPVGGRVVFATSPNPGQLSLPRAKDALETYNTDLDRLRVKGKWVVSEGSRGNVGFSIPGLAVLKTESHAARILISASREPSSLHGDTFQFRLLAVDAQGSVVDESAVALPIAAEGIVPAAFSSSSANVALSDRSLRQLQRCQRSGPYRNVERQSPYEAEDAKNSTSVSQGEEPLGLCVADLFVAIAHAQNLKLAALLPDSIARLPFQLAPGPKLTVSQLSKAIGKTSSVDMEVRDGWLIVKPIFTEDGERDYLDRKSLRDLVTSDSVLTSVSQIALSRLYSANPGAGDSNPLANMVVRLTMPGRWIPQRPKAEWLRFYATVEQALSPLDWGAANVARGSADASQLSPPQRQALVRALMSDPHSSRVGKDVRQVEPSEWKEDSLVGVLTWERLQTYCLSFSGDGMITPPLDIRTVADALAGRRPSEQELNQWFDVIANKTYSSIAVVHRRWLQLSFDGSGFNASVTIDSSLIKGRPVRSLEQLPSSVLSLIKKAPLN